MTEAKCYAVAQLAMRDSHVHHIEGLTGYFETEGLIDVFETAYEARRFAGALEAENRERPEPLDVQWVIVAVVPVAYWSSDIMQPTLEERVTRLEGQVKWLAKRPSNLRFKE